MNCQEFSMEMEKLSGGHSGSVAVLKLVMQMMEQSSFQTDGSMDATDYPNTWELLKKCYISSFI